jgi:predicted nucleotidyltransferase
MRTTAPALLPLFRSELQLQLLALILLQPERVWTARELQKALDAPAASVHRELQRALRAGIIRRESVGRTHQYRAANDSPLFRPLRELLDRTVGVEVELRSLLERMPDVQVAAIHGSYASGARVRPASDVDVVVIGDPDFDRLRSAIRRLEQRLGRRFDVQFFSKDEFRSMLDRRNSVARAVARGPRKPLVGDLKDVLEP